MVTERVDIDLSGDMSRTVAAPPSSDRQFLRFGAACAVIGGVLAAVSNVFHPRSSDSSDIAAELRLINDHGEWLFVHMAILVSVLVVFPGLVALARSLDVGAAAPWARLALYSAVASVPLALLTVGLDGIAMSELAEDWANANDPAALLPMIEAVQQIVVASFDVFIVALFGLTPLAAGAALMRSDLYPRWMGPVAILAGVLGLVTGIVQSFTGIEAATANVMFPLASLGFTVVIIAAGVTLWRRSAPMT